MRLTFKRFALFALALTVGSTPAFADFMKQSTAYTITWMMYDSTTHAPKTGLTPTVKISKAGAAGATSTNSAAEVDSTNNPGLYKVVLTTSETGTAGSFDVSVTASGADPAAFHSQVIGFDLNDTVRAGLTALPNAAANASGGLITAGTSTNQISLSSGLVGVQSGTGTGQISLSSGLVDITQTAADKAWSTATRALTDKSGFALTQTFPTNFSSLSIDASGRTDLGKWIGVAPLALSSQQVQAVVPSSTVVASVTGAVGSVTGAVGSVTGAVGSVTGSVGSIASGGIASTSFAAGAIDATAIATDAIGSAELAASGVSEIQSGLSTLTAANVWDLATTGHTTSGTFGAAMNAAGSAGDPWGTSLPGAYSSGTAGYILGTNLNGTISGVNTGITANSTDLGTLLGRLTATRSGYLDNLSVAPPSSSTIATDVWAAGTRTLTANPGLTSTQVENAVWDGLRSGHTTTGTFGAGVPVSGNVTVGGYASGQDPATLLMAAVVDGTLTVKQMMTCWQAYLAGDYTSSVSGSTRTTTYKRANGTTTIISTSTGLVEPQVRTVTLSNLP